METRSETKRKDWDNQIKWEENDPEPPLNSISTASTQDTKMRKQKLTINDSFKKTEYNNQWLSLHMFTR